MASSINESMIFLCDKVLLDGRRLLPLDPDVNFVFLRININMQQMQFIYKDSLDALAEERELVLKWEHITGTSISKEYSDNLITFKFNKSLCGFSICHLFVSNLVFNRLSAVVDIMYFNIMRTRYGLTEAQARENIRNVYVYEDDDFGLEEDFPNPGNNNSPGKNTESSSQSLISLDDIDSSSQTLSSSSANEVEDFSQSSVPDGESEAVIDENMGEIETEPLSQVPIDEMIMQPVPVNENETIVNLAIEEMDEEIELVNENDSILRQALEEKVVIIDEEDVEEK